MIVKNSSLSQQSKGKSFYSWWRMWQFFSEIFILCWLEVISPFPMVFLNNFSELSYSSECSQGIYSTDCPIRAIVALKNSSINVILVDVNLKSCCPKWSFSTEPSSGFKVNSVLQWKKWNLSKLIKFCNLFFRREERNFGFLEEVKRLKCRMS